MPMISEAFMDLFADILTALPVLELPTGFMASLNYFANVIGYVNVFLPVVRLLPVFALIVMIRRFDIIMSVINWIIRLIPFIG